MTPAQTPDAAPRSPRHPTVTVADPSKSARREHPRQRSRRAATTVVVAEPSPRYRERIVEAIQARPGLRLVGDVSDGTQALAAARRRRPDVLTVAVQLPGLSGQEVARLAREGSASTRVLVIGSPLGAATIADALDAGAWGYVWKGQDEGVIADAVAAVGRGERFLGPRVQSDLFENVRRRAEGRPLELSGTETEVLALVAEGMFPAAIADHLGLATSTVQGHLRRTYAKLGVSERAAAVAAAMRHGLLA